MIQLVLNISQIEMWEIILFDCILTYKLQQCACTLSQPVPEHYFCRNQLLTSCVSYRIEVDDLERTSIEDEVLNFSCDEDKQEQEVEDDMSDTHAADQEVTRILPEDVVQTEYCIVSSSKVLELLYRLHGHICSRNECGRQLSYQQTYVSTCLVVNWNSQKQFSWSFWRTMGCTANLF